MRARFGFSIVVASLGAALACAGQDGQQRTPLQRTATGLLSGSVYCADTNLPARMASITLIHISNGGFGTQGYGQTDLEGRFALRDVAEGDYYVVAVLPGYLNLLSSLTQPHLDAMTPEDRGKFLAQLAHVTVSASQPAQVSVRLERAAEIDGTAIYDDGSPAIGLRVSYRLKTAETQAGGIQARFMANQVFGQNGPLTSDDQGHFRILGVPPGEYLVHVTLPTRSSEQAERGGMPGMLDGPFGENELDVYVGGGLRESKAEIIKVDSGGANKNADITIPLSKLHTLRGQVLLKSSGQPPVTANVQLLYADDHEQMRSVFAPDGRFEIFYVPEDNFLLRAAAGSDPPPDIEETGGPAAQRQHVIWHFPVAGDGAPETPLQVTGDLENLTITVPDPAPNKKGPYMEVNGDGYGISAETKQ